MQKLVIGFVGWRGMVGSVLMSRMVEEGDFDDSFRSIFFSSSKFGEIGFDGNLQENAHDIGKLMMCDVIVTCQGSYWTNDVYPRLLSLNWPGIILDASSSLRMDDDAIIVLDPVNGQDIVDGLNNGIKKFAGGNCTVSLLLMALQGLFRENLIEWVSTSTYQAVSGAGAQKMLELAAQFLFIGNNLNFSQSAIELEGQINELCRQGDFPKTSLGFPMAYNLMPMIDNMLSSGQTKEERKSFVEGNKILGQTNEQKVVISGICVRVPVMRCHSQNVLIKMKREMTLGDIEQIIKSGNEWVNFIANTAQETMSHLTPAAVTGTLNINVGRLHKSLIGEGDHIELFTIGDQLLWGAAEPIRRALKIIISYLKR